MSVIYEVQVTYPNGHSELVEETFRSFDAAVEFGKSMLAQIAQTEDYHGKGVFFGREKKQSATFVVIKREGEEHSIVFDSAKAL